ncbi:uncharacterized protein LOC113383552 [Ctenocephalides felis]|uniref:uncharacterized protein LOC113383552 n=1 Tax=Ctenocephalides felis TaxID=7515 RepID=UPI000E6E39AA|nr:uncharacterized protein LOC113383552 [Ctenocephalides felis]
MIMDIQKPSGRLIAKMSERNSPKTAETPRAFTETSAPIKSTTKRPFDVAFLMLPDEKLKQRRLQEQIETQTINLTRSPEPEETPKTNQLRVKTDATRSAFTKVSYMQPSNKYAPSTSPDVLNCQESLSPPVLPQSPTALPGYIGHPSNFHQLLAYPEQTFTDKFRPILSYRPDFTPYQTFPPVQPSPPQEMNVLRHPAAAAAILTSLLPQTFSATFSLPAQNVCAKCNVSFRMTSDLVYHMRSHHKSETQADPARRRREDKLRCPVCFESFRERHHLTRHMTAHQDKEGDSLDEEEKNQRKIIAK